MTTRVNARLDADLARKLEELRRRTGRSTTEILRASIEAYFDATTRRDVAARELLADLVASGDASPDLSEDHKTYLLRGLASKV